MVSAVLPYEISQRQRRNTQRGFGYAFAAAVVLHVAVFASFIDRQPSTEVLLATSSTIKASLIVLTPKPAVPPVDNTPDTTKPISPSTAKATPPAKPALTTQQRIIPKPAPIAATAPAQPLPIPSEITAVEDTFAETTEALTSDFTSKAHDLATETKAAAPAVKHYIPPSSQVAALQNPEPNYPRAARMRGMQGVVQLKVLVDENGRALKIVLSDSSGFNILDREAIRTVEQWRFIPASENGIAVRGEVLVPIRFELRG